MKIYAKTEAGQIAFKTRSGVIPARLRSVYILFDGKKTLSEVLEVGTALGATVTDIYDLIAAGMLAPVGDGDSEAALLQDTLPGELVPLISPDSGHAPLQSGTPLTPAEMYARAMPIATRITSELGLRGFRLNLAVESAMGYQDLCNLLPKIKAAAGDTKVRPLERALGLR